MYYVNTRKTDSKSITKRSLTFPERTTRNCQQSVNREVCFLVGGGGGSDPFISLEGMIRTTELPMAELGLEGFFWGGMEDRMKGKQRK